MDCGALLEGVGWGIITLAVLATAYFIGFVNGRNP